MKRWHISTTALCTVHITVEAETAEDAVTRAPPHGGWEIGHSIVGDVYLDEGTYEVREVDELGRDVDDTAGARGAPPATAA